MGPPSPQATRVPLMLARAVADRLETVDETTLGRVRAAVSFAEVAMGLFQASNWSGSPGVPALDGVLLFVRFDRPSERFYVHDFVDLLGTEAVTATSCAASGVVIELLLHSGVEAIDVPADVGGLRAALEELRGGAPSHGPGRGATDPWASPVRETSPASARPPHGAAGRVATQARSVDSPSPLDVSFRRLHGVRAAWGNRGPNRRSDARPPSRVPDRGHHDGS